MNKIGIYQSLCNRSYFEHKCLNNIKKIYQHAGKCDDQQNLKDILDDAMVSTPEEIKVDSPSLPMAQTTVKKPSASKSMCLFTNIFDVKRKNQNILLELQNKNAELLQLVIACGPFFLKVIKK